MHNPTRVPALARGEKEGQIVQFPLPIKIKGAQK